VEAPRPTFIGRPLPMQELTAPRAQRLVTDEDHFAALLDWWRGKGGRCSQAELLEFLYRIEVIDRAGAVHLGANDELVFAFAGIGLDLYKRYDASWAEQTAGRLFLDQPDPVYAAWVGHAYRGVIASQKPSYDFVDALVRLPDL